MRDIILAVQCRYVTNNIECFKPATVTLVAGCEHEHTMRAVLCETHSEGNNSAGCWRCQDAGHNCKTRVISITPGADPTATDTIIRTGYTTVATLKLDGGDSIRIDVGHTIYPGDKVTGPGTFTMTET